MLIAIFDYLVYPKIFWYIMVPVSQWVSGLTGYLQL